ncbi:hypothetical protein [Flammeovirga pacifica]|uniref:hypothetical protein n=1 Tax=Flammeovirga pacifica TaxID=915059 RepID=UPI0011149138|nr:hypothetical protein [Flammeovirga pacifica]
MATCILFAPKHLFLGVVSVYYSSGSYSSTVLSLLCRRNRQITIAKSNIIFEKFYMTIVKQLMIEKLLYMTEDLCYIVLEMSYMMTKNRSNTAKIG